MKNLVLLITLCHLITMPAYNQTLPSNFTEKVDAFVEKAMATANVTPGLGLAVVKDDQIVIAKGYGYRDVEKQLPVTGETGFYIASTTKSLTGMAAAQMEYHGILSLNDPISKFYPNRKFFSPLDADKITLLQLMSHNHNLRNSGLQFHLAFIDEHSPDDFERVLFDFSRPRREGFQYSNFSINIAANAFERASGKSWKELHAQYVFAPVGMQHTTSYMSLATKRDYAWPYIKLNGKYQRLDVKTDGQMQSAGGTVTTPKDYARWLIVNLNEGKIDGQQVVPAEVIKRAHQSYAEVDRNYFKFHRTGYGLGLYHSDYEGELLMHHFGGFDGYMSHTSFMPKHKIGVVAFANEVEFGGRLAQLVAAYIYDLLLKKENLEEKYEQELEKWKKSVAEYQKETNDQLAQKKSQIEKAASNPENWQLDAAAFVGTYNNPRIGHFQVIAKSDNTLWATYGPNMAQMLPLAKNQFLVDWQLTGLTDPPVTLDVQYNKGELNSLLYGGREFKLLPKGTHPSDLIDIYKAIDGFLSQHLDNFQKENAANLKTLLHQNYTTGALTEPYMNSLGYRYLNAEYTDIAIAIFEVVLDFYPQSSNAYDSLGEAFLRAENKALAKKNYQKALELDPDNENAQRMLKEIEGK